MLALIFLIAIVLVIAALKVSIELWKFVAAMFILIILLVVFADPVDAYEYSPSEIVKIGKVVHHEAGNQSDLGKRLVADTILNRVESGEFPDTVEGVLGQKGQYCDPDEFPPKDIYKLIAEEIYTRTNNQVLWYRTKKYHTYGTPLIKEGDHYFSGGI